MNLPPTPNRGAGMAFPRAIPALALGLALGASACTVDVSTESTTDSYDVESFDAINVGNAIEVIVTVGDEQAIEIDVDEDIEDKLEVEVKDGTLHIGYSSSTLSFGAPTVARIQVPELTAVEMNGATDMTVTGLTANDFKADVNGASSLEVDGDIVNLDVEANGASSADFQEATVETASVDANGASDIDVRTADSVSGSADGASSVTVGDDVSVDVETSGASSIDQAS